MAMGMYNNKELARRRRSGKCFVYVLGAFVILCTLLLVFASLLRLRNPHLNLRSASSKQISYSASPSFNATLVMFLTINNPNFGAFSYQKKINNRVSVFYSGVKIADRQINVTDRVSFRETKQINVTLILRSAKVPVTAKFSSDINSGSLNLTTSVNFSGTVHLLKIINFKKTVKLACAMNLNLTSHAVHGIQCQ